MSQFQESVFKTPLGFMRAAADEEGLYCLEFIDSSEECKETASANRILQTIEQELNLYFQGTLQEFKTPLSLVGTPFQKSVWEELQKIPYGKTRSYAEVASLIGRPSSFRAVARANSTNRIAIVIPCHRVIYADGTLGGYSSGLEKKERLLQLEAAKIKL